MSEAPKLDRERFYKITLAFLILLPISYIIISIFSSLAMTFVYVSSRIDETYLEMSFDQKNAYVEKLMKETQEKAKTNSAKFLEEEFLNHIVTDRASLLFWDRIFWGIAFLIPAYIFLDRILKVSIAKLEDPFEGKSVLKGIQFGISIAIGFILFAYILEKFGIKLENGALQTKLFSALKGNTYLFLWAVYSVGIVTGIVEELYFRGFMMKSIAESGFPREGLIISSFIFGIMHFQSDASIAIPVLLTIVGFLFGIIYLVYKNIWVSIAAHAAYNTFGLLFGYLLGDGPK